MRPIWFVKMSVLSSGDHRVIFHVIECDEPRDCGEWSTYPLVTFVLQHHFVKVTSSVFQPAMSKKRTILSSDQLIEVLRLVDEARVMLHLSMDN